MGSVSGSLVQDSLGGGGGGRGGGEEGEEDMSGVFRIAFRQRRGWLARCVCVCVCVCVHIYVYRWRARAHTHTHTHVHVYVYRWRAYADTKLLNAMIAAECARRFEADTKREGEHARAGRGRGGLHTHVPISSVAVRPGTVATDISRDSKVGQVLIGVAKFLGLTRPLPRAAMGILHACTMPLPSPSAATCTTSSSLFKLFDASSAPAPYSIYYDDALPVPPHPVVLDAASTARAWQDSEQLLREWEMRSVTGGTPKAEVIWGFDLPNSLATWDGVTYAPASASKLAPASGSKPVEMATNSRSSTVNTAPPSAEP
jgi:hypothetical protein